MGKKVTVNLFDVAYSDGTPKLSETLDAFAALPIESRWRGDIRLDTVERVEADAALQIPVYHLDFAKSRSIGPGKLTHREAIADVGLGDEELFGEETAALYVPRKKWLLVLHNQYGVGPSKIAEYLNALHPGDHERLTDYEVSPKIDSRALQRMQSMKHLSHISVTASVGAFDEAEDDLGESVKEAAEAARAVRLHLKLEANAPYKHGGHLNLPVLRNLIDMLLKNVEEVDKLEVKGSGSADEKDQLINLLQHKIRKQFPDTNLIVANHRYTYESKIHLLRATCRAWLDRLS